MRKITREAYQAFINKKPFKKSNTTVQISEDGTVTLLLFNNVIAKQVGGTLSITSAGWPTPTTKERLNSFPDVQIKQRKGVWYLNDIFWDGSWIDVHNYVGS